MKIYVVDNGGQWTHREWRVLKYMDVDTKIIPNTTPFDELGDVDALVLSGGAPSVATEADAMGNNGEYLDKADFPILGICAGMQFLSEHFGGTLGPADSPEFSSVDLHITDHECLFRIMNAYSGTFPTTSPCGPNWITYSTPYQQAPGTNWTNWSINVTHPNLHIIPMTEQEFKDICTDVFKEYGYITFKPCPAVKDWPQAYLQYFHAKSKKLVARYFPDISQIKNPPWPSPQNQITMTPS